MTQSGMTPSPPGRLSVGELAGCLWKPLRGPGVVWRALIGTVAAVVPLLGWLALGGFQLRIIRHTLRQGVRPLPDWRRIPALLLDGLQLFLLLFAFLLPALIVQVLTLALMLFRFGPLSGFGPGAGMILAIGLVGVALFVLWFLFAMVVLPCATLQLAGGGLRRAFALRSHVRQIVRFARVYGMLLGFIALTSLPALVWMGLQVWDGMQRGPGAPPPPLFSLLLSPVGLTLIPVGFWANVANATAIGLVGRQMGVTSDSNRSALPEREHDYT